MAARKSARKPATRAASGRRGIGFLILLACILVFAADLIVLDKRIRVAFEGRRWSIPATVFARPLELFTGARLGPDQLDVELAAAAYQSVAQPHRAGQYKRTGDDVLLITRPFRFSDGEEPQRSVRVRFAGGAIASVTDVEQNAAVDLVRLDPAIVGRFVPSHNEDRDLIKLDEVPRKFTDLLISTEDRRFYHHWGLDPMGIARAMWVNLQAGRFVQGGSTITQQLVKNFFLTNERTLLRKLNELPMAFLLELHYGKDDILESYLNEIYMGQDGPRAVHGFGLASNYYFAADLRDLDVHQMALLVGMVKGPSEYDPRRHPEAALARRNTVLDTAVSVGVISADEASRAKKKPLDVVPRPPGGTSAHPAFFDLVRRQLREQYREEDLTNEGLQIFTTLIPHVQRAAENALKTRVPLIEKSRGLTPGTVQAAAVFTTTDGGEVVAVCGGREARFAGFNRALDAKRQIGSLVKPAVYLAALNRADKYTLATLVEDAPIRITDSAGNVWSPGNYDHKFHGQVPVYEALAHSYNLPTAKIGLDVGVDAVVKVLHALGVKDDIKPFPSVLLGAVELTPLQVAQMYQTYANDGFRTPLRAIREVVTAEGEPLQRYPLEVQQALPAGPTHLVSVGMQHVVTGGTAYALAKTLSPSLNLAGKTGTTDDMRDSWFAGFSGNYVGVVWVGRDDNKPSGFTGATGALLVWGDVFAKLNVEPLELTPPDDVETAWIDTATGSTVDSDCPGAVRLPFLNGSVPASGNCGGDGIGGAVDNAVNWFKGILQ